MKFNLLIRGRCRSWLAVMLSFSGVGGLTGATLDATFTGIDAGTDVNLTSEGTLDWVHWGLYTATTLTRKATVEPRLPNFEPIGFNGPYQYADNVNGYSWMDGGPTREVAETPTGVWMFGATNGFRIEMEAPTTPVTLKVYVGTYGARGRFHATLPGTELSYTDTSVFNMSNGPGGVYAITFAGDEPGQRLVIEWTVSMIVRPDGNVTLQAAALTGEGVNNPPYVAITSPVANHALSGPADVMLEAEAGDADGSVAGVEFFANGTSVGQATSSPFTFEWIGVPPGRHVITARVTDDAGGMSEAEAVELFVHGSEGSLSGVFEGPPQAVNLTAEGTADWVHWGLEDAGSINHKADVPRAISELEILGSENTSRHTDALSAFSWSDGTPIANASEVHDGIYVTGHPNGVRFTVPADTTPRTLRVYAGLYGSAGTFRAWLSDHSAAPFVDQTLSSVYGAPQAVYSLNYRAASFGQTLTVEFSTDILFDSLYANVSVQATTLVGEPPDNFAPTVTLTQPADNATFEAPADLLIVADATDADGVVAVVEYFANGEKLGETTAVPHEYAWNGVPAGTYELTARATDDDGASAMSASVTVTVETVVENQPPTVTLIQPADNATFEAPADLLIVADATDSDGMVVVVEYFANGEKLGETTAVPHEYAWNGVPAGTYELTARATDDDGASAMSASVTVTVETVVENQPPTVTLIQPADNATFEAPADILIVADATDEDGTVVRVEFHAGGTKIGEVIESPFTFSWEGVTQGDYLIRAVAVDDRGAETASEAVEITVTAPPDEEIHLVDAGMEDGQITFSFSSQDGANYTIWFTESLLEVSWQMLTQVSGNGGMLTITDDPGLAGARYYRVSRE